MPKFKEIESYQHKYAKELLRDWIAETWKNNDTYNTCPIKFIDEDTGKESEVNWRCDFISMEHPITKDFPMDIDETSACKLNYSERLSLLPWSCKYNSEERYCPCLKCEYFDKRKLVYVVDIAIEHKGLIATIIEVTHKNPIDPKKQNFLRQQMNKNCGGLEAFEISAKHILGQIKKPDRLFIRRF